MPRLMKEQIEESAVYLELGRLFDSGPSVNIQRFVILIDGRIELGKTRR